MGYASDFINNLKQNNSNKPSNTTTGSKPGSGSYASNYVNNIRQENKKVEEENKRITSANNASTRFSNAYKNFVTKAQNGSYTGKDYQEMLDSVKELSKYNDMFDDENWNIIQNQTKQVTDYVDGITRGFTETTTYNPDKYKNMDSLGSWYNKGADGSVDNSRVNVLTPLYENDLEDRRVKDSVTNPTEQDYLDRKKYGLDVISVKNKYKNENAVDTSEYDAKYSNLKTASEYEDAINLAERRGKSQEEINYLKSKMYLSNDFDISEAKSDIFNKYHDANSAYNTGMATFSTDIVDPSNETYVYARERLDDVNGAKLYDLLSDTEFNTDKYNEFINTLKMQRTDESVMNAVESLLSDRVRRANNIQGYKDSSDYYQNEFSLLYNAERQKEQDKFNEEYGALYKSHNFDENRNFVEDEKLNDVTTTKYEGNLDYSQGLVADAMGIDKNDDNFVKEVLTQAYYYYINGETDKAETLLSNTGITSSVAESDKGLFYMDMFTRDKVSTLSDKERDTANYIYNTQGAEAFGNFMQNISQGLKLKAYDKAIESAEEYARANPVTASVETIVASPVATVSSLIGMLRNDGEYSQAAQLQANFSAIRNKIASDLEASGNGVGSFLYQAGMSTADNLYLMAISALTMGGGAASFGEACAMGEGMVLGLMGSSVATQTYQEARNEGYGWATASLKALVNGGVEILTEKIGLDNVVKNIGNVSGATLGKRLLQALIAGGKSAIPEGMEEIAANWFDRIGDTIVDAIAGRENDFRNSVMEYVAQGMSEGEAAAKVLGEYIGEDALAGAMGAVSGFGMGVGGGVIQAVTTTARNAVDNTLNGTVEKTTKVKEDGKTTKKTEVPNNVTRQSTVEVLKTAKDLAGNNTEVVEKINETIKRVESGERVSNSKINNLVQEASGEYASKTAKPDTEEYGKAYSEAMNEIYDTKSRADFLYGAIESNSDLRELDKAIAMNDVAKLTDKTTKASKDFTMVYGLDATAENIAYVRDALDAKIDTNKTIKLNQIENVVVNDNGELTFELRDGSFAHSLNLEINDVESTIVNAMSNMPVTIANGLYKSYQAYSGDITNEAEAKHFVDSFMTVATDGRINGGNVNVNNYSAVANEYGDNFVRVAYEYGATQNKISQHEINDTGIKTSTRGEVTDKTTDKAKSENLVKLSEKIANKIGVNIEIVDSLENNSPGYYTQSNNTISLAVDSKRGVAWTLFHEMFEFVDSNNSSDATKIMKNLMSWYKSRIGATKFNQTLEAYQNAYADIEKSKSERSAMKEMCADAMANLFQGKDGAKDLAKWLNKNVDTSTKAKIKAFIDNIISVLQELFSGTNRDSLNIVQNDFLDISAESSTKEVSNAFKQFREDFFNALDETSDITNDNVVENKNNSTEVELRRNIIIKDSGSVVKEMGINNVNDIIGVAKKAFNYLYNYGFLNGNNRISLENKNTGKIIEIDKKGINETFSKGERFEFLSKFQKELKIAVVPYLDKIVEEAVPKEQDVPDKYGRINITYSYFEDIVSINEKEYVVRFDVRQSEVKNKFHIHYLDVLENKGSNTSESTSDLKESAIQTMQTYSSDVSISKNGNGVKRQSIDGINSRDYHKVVRQNQKLSSIIEGLEQELRTTTKNSVSYDDCQMIAEKLIGDHLSDVDLKALTKEIQSLARLHNQGAVAGQLTKKAQKIAKMVLDKSSVVYHPSSESKAIADAIKSKTFKLSNAQMKYISETLGITVDEFTNANADYVSVGNVGTYATQFWDSLCKQYPEVFDKSMPEKEIPLALVTMSQILTEEYVDGVSYSDYVDILAGQILDSYANLNDMSRHSTIADELKNVKAQLKDEVEKNAKLGEEFKRANERYERKINEEKEKTERARERTKETRREYKAKMENMKAYFRYKMEQQKQNANIQKVRAKLKDSIFKTMRDFKNMLAHPKEGKFVPQRFGQMVYDACAMVQYANSQANSRLSNLFTDIKNEYARMKDSKNNQEVELYDQNVYDMIDNAVDIINDEINENTGERLTLGKMSVKGLSAINEVLSVVHFQVTNAAKTFAVTKYNSIKNLASTLTYDHKVNKGGQRGLNWLIEKAVRPKEVFEGLGGYAKNNSWMEVFNRLNEAQHKELNFKYKYYDFFADVIDFENNGNRKLFDDMTNAKKLVTLDYGLGKSISVPKDIMLELYFTLSYKANKAAAVHGGVLLPDFYKNNGQTVRQAMGAQLDAYNDKSDKVQRLNLSEAEWDRMLASIQSEIDKSEYLQQWVNLTKEFFEMANVDRNKTLLDMYGFEGHSVDEYFPISRDMSYDATEPTNAKYKPKMLETIGIMQDRTGGTALLKMKGLSKVINSYIADVSRFNAYSAIQKDVYRALDARVELPSTVVDNTTMTEYSGDIKNEGMKAVTPTDGSATLIDREGKPKGYFDGKSGKFTTVKGEIGKGYFKYIDNLIKDLTKTHESSAAWDTIDGMLGKVRSNVARSALTLNLGVAFGQAGSYPTALGVISAKSLTKALTGSINGEGELQVRADKEFINRYTDILRNRSAGNPYSGLENMGGFARQGLIDKAMNAGIMPYFTQWINKIDEATVGRLWTACVYEIKDNDSKWKNLDLKEATEEVKDEFYKEVAKTFERVVEETQPNYSVMQRSAFQRNAAIRTLGLSMFMTQRLQNLSIQYSAIMRAKKYNADFKKGINGVTEEDVKMANKGAAKAVGAVALGTFTLYAFKELAQLALHQIGKLIPGKDDDEDKLTGGNVALQTLINFGNGMASNIPFGNEIYELGESLITGQKWYGLNATGVNTVTDFIQGLVEDGTKMFDDEGHFNEDRMMSMVLSTCEILGIPFRQGKNYVDAIKGWANDIAHKDFAYDLGADTSSTKGTMAFAFRNYTKTEDKDALKEEMQKVYDHAYDKDVKDNPGKSEAEHKDSANSSVRNAISNALRDKYKEAYEKGDTDTMYDIQEFLRATGVFDSPAETLSKWRDAYKEALKNKGVDKLYS